MEDYLPKPRYFNTRHAPVIGRSWSGANALLDCMDQIKIGDYVSFGHDVKLLTGSHNYTLKGADRQEVIISAPITIEDGVWLASNVTVLGGVTIGRNSVVGANSLVTKDIPPDEVWFGTPAKFQKRI